MAIHDRRQRQTINGGRRPTAAALPPTRKTALAARLSNHTPPCNRIQCRVINSRPFNMRRLIGGVCRASGGAYSRSYPRVNASKAPLSRIILRVFLRLFSPGLRLVLPQIWPHRGEPTRAGLKRNRTRIYSPTHRPSKTPSAAPSAFHRRFVGYHRPPRRLRPTPVHCARKRLAHIALRRYDERFVCSGCFRWLR